MLRAPVSSLSRVCVQVWVFVDNIQGWRDAVCSQTPGLAGWWGKVAVPQPVPPRLEWGGEKKAVTNRGHKDKASSFSDALSLLYLYGHPQLSHSTATPLVC